MALTKDESIGTGVIDKWHLIEKGRALPEDEIGFVVELVMAWIDNQISVG